MTNVSSLCIGSDATILDAISRIDGGACQIALVVDGSQRLVGTVTDGDVRRAILRGLPLSAPVSNIMGKSPRVALVGTSNCELLRLMRVLEIHQLPLVDEEHRVVDLCSIDALLEGRKRPNRVVLMAGGLGKRLHPLTEVTPKPMLTVGGKPLLETIVETFAGSGFYRFDISLNYLGDIIREHFGDGSQWGVEIRYISETQRMGTAGCLTLLPDRPEEPFIVMNGDILTSISFPQILQFHVDNDVMATMALYEHTFQIPYGVVNVEGHNIACITEKPEYRFLINAGIYILNPEAIDFIPHHTSFDMTDLFKRLIEEKRKTAAFPIREYWLDIGSPQDLKRAEAEFLNVFLGSY
jgi:dTDP-glucose pyrophosphorylase